MLLDDYQLTTTADTAVIPCQMYTNPNNAIEFTETQRELVEKFNTAFYEAQNRSSGCQISTADHENILDTFDECYFTNIENYEDTPAEEDYIFDLLLPEDGPPSSVADSEGSNFDYDDFCMKFEQQVNERKDPDDGRWKFEEFGGVEK